MAASSALSDDLPDIPQQSLAIHDRRRRVLDQPLLAYDAVRIDEEKGPIRRRRLLIEDAVVAHDRPLGKVAEERERQLQGLGKRLLREWVARADREVLDAELLEALVVGLPGREVRRSRRYKIGAVELEENP